MTEFPRFFRVRQLFDRPQVADIRATINDQLERLALNSGVQPGQSVAVTAGSRGIANIGLILNAVVTHLKRLGADVFLVPAMGSHGGGTAEGQVAVLQSCGITPAACGCEIRAGMETEIVCNAPEGFPIHMDRHAYRADHLFICGRIKPHTRFVGPVESGLMKMLLIGLGKHAGAEVYHRAIHDYCFGQIVQSVGREVIERCSILGGLAIVENAYDETALLEAVPPERFESREAELLQTARQWMPRLPFDRADLVLIDEIGKDVSGAGLDTNVVGRKYLDHVARDDEWPKIKFLAVRGLSPGTHGNATGIGLAEFCRSQVVREMDRRVTRINCLTGNHPTAAMLPIDFETDRELLTAVLSVMGLTPASSARCLRISNTLALEQLECSEPFWDEAAGRSDLEILVKPRILPFAADGNWDSVATGAHSHGSDTRPR